MTDPFTSLRRTDNRAEVDPAFRAELLTEVRRRLADTAPVTDERLDVPLIPIEFDDEPPGQRRRPVWILVAAAAVTAIGVAALALARGDDDPAGEVPADQPATNAPNTVAGVTEESLQLSDRRVRESAALRVGFVGLPPVGARPSTPEQEVLIYDIAPCSPSHGFEGLSVLADGRLIWAVSGRLVEQRLSPEGVELMRSELLGSGLFDGDDGNDECLDGKYSGHSEVTPNSMGSEFGAPRYADVARLADPWSWLPASAWADTEIKAFVASEYSVYITGGSSGFGPHTTNPAPELPAAVQEFVRGREWECQRTSKGLWCYTPSYSFTTDEVRRLVEALEGAGFVAENTGTVLEYHDETSILIELSPRLPWEVGVGPIPG
jgi:hypothetical protein